MTSLTDPRRFLYRTDALDPDLAQQLTREALARADDGELYLQYRATESFGFDDGRLKTADYSTDAGFGLRAVSGEMTGFAHASDISAGAIRRAAETLALLDPAKAPHAPPPPRTNRHLYDEANPLDLVPFADGFLATDIRPLVRLNVSIVVEENGRRESGYFGLGGRYMYDHLFEEAQWNRAIDEALAQALVNLRAVDAPAGEMTVLLGPGWPGVLLHEAVGHGLEGDFNRKGTSAFSGRIGERVAAPGVTVVDDGAMASPVGGGRRGSLSIDDEGTPTRETVLIEDGILKGYMQDRLNARLMGVEPTGNGRRESFAHAPMPRMTNTFMRGGHDDPSELLSRVKNGIFAKSFGGGQVDIVSGKFVFSCTEAYKIKDGKLGDPIKGATLIGDGPSVLTKVTGIGNDMAIDEGIGICGKGGQSVPAGVGQPTLLVSGLTVGGTA
jgi:TldD protein